MLHITQLDHLVLTVHDLAATVHFYQQVLGLPVEEFKPGRLALRIGQQKINLHPYSQDPPHSPFLPNARHATPGSADLCLIVVQPLNEVVTWLSQHGIAIEEGPVQRTGANGPLCSVYCRDPDGNLVELSNPL